MENASKALMIAGAIIIAIVLISVGMMIVNSGQEAIDESISGMDQFAKDSFNSKFFSYEGRQSGSNVKALIQAIQSNNNQNYEIEGKTISIEFENITSSSLTAKSPIEMAEPTEEAANEFSTQAANLRVNINTGAKYDVTVNTSAATGLVSRVKITKI